jgi:alpha-galactosidase
MRMNLFPLKKFFCLLIVGCLFTVVANAQDTLSKYILTPKESPQPKINGPKIFGVRPNHPIVFTIPATGERPMSFSADNLPKGVTVEAKT